VDILLINASVYELPVAQRAGAIVYEGTVDLGLWRPPGPDRDLLHAYGESLSDVLAKERAQIGRAGLRLGEARRLHPGKLRCDYLIWVATRGHHGETEAAAPPSLEALEQAAESALALAARHATLRVAFGTAGSGPGAAPTADRLAALVRGSHRYRSACLDQGLASRIEEVYVCAPSAAEIAKAKRLTTRLAKEHLPSNGAAVQRAVERSAAARNGASRVRSPRTPRAPRLDPGELAAARAAAQAYDRSRAYREGDWFIHARFGAGKVQSVLGPERMVTVMFEDGQERKLVHARP
jgi:O-acetyl-ADP-ribose deacetylase (regulator of RNase III)